jgi:hypothetical protein
MKKTLITTLLLVAAVGAFAQGSLNFGNQFGSTVIMPIYNVDPANPLHVVTGNSALSKPSGTTVYAGGLLSGPGFTLALFAGAQGTASDQLRLAGSAPLRSGATPTALPNGLITTLQALPIDGVAPGGIAQLEIRAWDNRGGTVDTWAKVLADPTVARGTSGTFLSGSLGGVGPDGPILPPNTTGWQSFGLFVVPEPSTIALAVLGLGSVLLFRRRK